MAAAARWRVEMLLLVLAPLLWMTQSWTSLWLDEALTYWVVKDGPGEALRRVSETHGQSPLYFLTAWLAITVGGNSEFVLRFPSLLATGLATWTLYPLGRRLFDRETGLIAATLFAYWVFLATNVPYNARPYAMALFAVAASTLTLMWWLESNRFRDACAYGFFATLVVYSQPAYAPLFGIHLFLLLEYRWRGNTVVTIQRFSASLAVVAILTIPLMPQIANVRRLLRAVYRGTPSLTELGVSLLWATLIVALLAAVQRRLPVRAPAFLYVWCLVPPLWLIALILMSGDSGSVGRYQYWQFPALVLALAAVIRALRPRVRITCLAAVALVAFTQANRPALEDWRAATELARPLIETDRTPVFVRTGLPEARLVEWLDDRRHADYLLAPLVFYRLPGAIRPLPHDIDEAYLRGSILPGMESQRRIVIVAHDFNFEQMQRLPLREWLDKNLPHHKARHIARIHNIVVIAYDLI